MRSFSVWYLNYNVSTFPPVFCNDSDCCLINAHNKFLFAKQLLCAKGNDLQAIPTILTIGGTPYNWILNSELPPLDFANFNSVLLTILGICANGAVALIALILILILAWNYIKLLFEAAERYVLLGVLVYTAPVAFAMGASQTTSGIFKSWCRMFGGQVFLLLMNAWCLRLFTSMVGNFLSNPLSL